MAGKIKALQQWCRKMTEGYPRVDVANFTTAWRDGLAFCAIIHRFRPDLIDFDSLSPENVFENCKMAFEVAEKELSIPAFLEADDMVRLKVPDKLSIITYVSQYYNYLHSLPQLGGPGVKSKVSGKTVSGVKRPTDSDSTQGPISKKATTVETKENAAPAKVAATVGGDRCGICHEHVYLIERHMEDGKLYHRSCFRRSELSPANKVYTRSPFMSPSLSSEAQKLVVSKAENKTNLLSKADRDGLVTNLQRHMDNQPAKAESDTKLSRKLDFVGSKHPIDEPVREDTKKSKMQPRILFDEETRKAPTEKEKSAAYSSKQSNEVNKLLPLSGKEAHKLEKRQDDIGSEKALKEQPGNTKLNISVFSQQKNKTTQEIPAPAVSMPANNKSQNKSDNISGASKISVAALSLQPLTESSQSKNKSTTGKDSQKISKEAEKPAVSKDIQKSSDKKNVDIATSKSNLLPDIHNLQKLFSGKPADTGESAAPSYPKAKPRNSTIRSENQESSKDMMATKPNENETARPKPVPRNSVLGISAPQQPELSSQIKKSAFKTEASDRSSASKPLVAGISLSVSNNAQSQLSTSTTSSPFDSTYKASSTEKILSETKISITGKNKDEPRNIPLINQPHSLQQKIGANKVINQNSIDLKSANKSGHASVLNVSNVIKTTATTSLLTTMSDSSVRTTLTPAKLQSSTPLSQVQSENKFISSSRNPVNKTVNDPPSYSGNLVSQTQMAHSSAGVNNSVKLMANGTQSTKKVDKSVVTQMSKDSPKTVVNTPKLQTPNKMQEALTVFSSGKPMSGAFGITFTNNSAKEDASLTKPEKVKDSSSKPALSHITDIHSKEKTISDIPSQNKNQNRQAIPSSSNLLNSKDNQQKSAVKTSQSDSKQTDKHESKGLSSVKKSAISISKEDILDINNIKLKRVMPEQREVQNEQKTSMYDVKLKKVDVIKGDSKWDSSSQKPSRSVDVAGTGYEQKTAGSYFSGGEINNEVSSNKGMDTKAAALSAGVSNSHTTTTQKMTSEMPQWKKAAEEKQRKLTDIVVGSEHKTDNVKHLKHNDNITAITFDSKTGLTSNGKTNKREHVSVGVLSLLKTPSETASTEKEPAKALTTQKYVNKVPPTAEDPGLVKKLDWQLEAEKRMAAIANFDKGIIGKLEITEKSETASSDRSGNQQLQRNTAAHKMPKDNKNNDSIRINGETVTGSNRVTEKTTTHMLEKSVVKAKETELKVTVNKLKLTPVQEISKEVELSIDTKQTNSEETEDFRQVLHQLKHVTTEDTGKIDSAKPDSETCLPSRQTAHYVHTPTAHRAVPNSTVNKNNNNNQNIPDKSHISDMHNTQVLNKNTSLSVKTPELEDLADENGNVRKNGIFEVSENKHSMGKSRFAEKGNTSPKVKRKLSIPDNKTREMPSPSSPTQRKKIQITSRFDFEKSSDFEHSLILSTAELTITENPTPEKLMSSPSSQVTLSPQHISAIELQQQLHNIDTRLTELELKGRELENSIRKVNSLDEDDDNLMIEWFTLINEKNDLVRKEADLIYISKEQELEDEQEQIESQLLYLMTKPDECKSPEEKEEEDYLINRKIALVEQRNKIIDSMDEDRIRYEAEDKNIEVTLKDKGYWKDSTGTLKAVKGKKVANSMFYT
ncbi:unnamed protein product [Candidula unifasciata]|uniref:MICAL-like protein 2 n=1 Tax=Candidula unifasciata TaxID=100452 RepID=A0A8S4A490_9EUPU|nr:unnamed protein product [Candidula unifasciata]